MGNPWQARRWREGGTEGTYSDMDPDVRPPQLADLATPQPTAAWADHSSYPANGNVEQVLAWVGADAERAAYALAAEHHRPLPRRTVVGPLQALGAT
jgi:hypothetical protein